MEENVRWMVHRGKRVLYADFSTTNNVEDVKNLLNKVNSEFAKVVKGELLYINNMDKAFVSPQVMPLYKEATAHTHEVMDKWAVIGFNNVKSMIFDLLKKTIGIKGKPCSSLEEALDYVTSSHS